MCNKYLILLFKENKKLFKITFFATLLVHPSAIPQQSVIFMKFQNFHLEHLSASFMNESFRPGPIWPPRGESKEFRECVTSLISSDSFPSSNKKWKKVENSCHVRHHTQTLLFLLATQSQLKQNGLFSRSLRLKFSSIFLPTLSLSFFARALSLLTIRHFLFMLAHFGPSC